MELITGYLIIGLACWRISLMLVHDIGPYDMFLRLRTWLGVRESDDVGRYIELKGSKRQFTDKTFETLAEGISCMYCTSLWVGLFFALIWLAWPRLAMGVSVPFVLSAITVLMERVRGDNGQE